MLSWPVTFRQLGPSRPHRCRADVWAPDWCLVHRLRFPAHWLAAEPARLQLSSNRGHWEARSDGQAPGKLRDKSPQAKFLQKALPQVVAYPEPPEGFSSIIPAAVLALSRTDDMIATGRLAAHIAERLREVELPAIQSQAVDPLFNGTISFARLMFTVETRGNAVVSLSDADVATAIDYASRAVVPIAKYVEQYAPTASRSAGARLCST
jgi:hypothetical protein